MAEVGLCVKKRFGGDESKTCYCADCSPNPSSDVLERVAQSDREAAAAIVEWQNGTGWEPQFFHPKLAAGMREGVWDDHDVVQAFARHRLATIERLSAELERHEALAKAVKTFRNSDTEYNRANNAQEQPRLNKAGTRYACDKFAMFKALAALTTVENSAQ